MTSDRRDAWVVLWLAVFVAFAFQGSRHLWDPDEGRYTEVAHQMLDTGDWLVPRLEVDRPHLTKPPLTHWAIATGFLVVGRNEWGARFFHALAFVATALLVLAIARRLQLPSPALAAALWSTLLGPVAGANIVSTDHLLVLFETLAVYGFVSSGVLEGASPARPAALRLMWLGFGLAFLTKGPPGLLPLLAIVAWTAWKRRTSLARLFDTLGLALFALVGLGWYLLLVARAPDLLHYFVFQETIERIANDRFRRNGHAFGWIEAYGPILVAGTLPWLLIIPWLRWRARFPAATPSTPVAMPVQAPLSRAARRLLWIWISLPMAVFILSRSRLALYVLPLFVPIALLAATAVPRTTARRTVVTAVVIAAVFVTGMKGCASLIHRDNDAHRLASEFAAAIDLRDFDEIAFVDVPARYGLRRYLGLEIAQVETESGLLGPAGYVPPVLVCEELAETERHLFVVPLARLEAFERQLATCPGRAVLAGQLRRWMLYRPLPAPG